MSPSPFQGLARSVIVTRPAAQAKPLALALEQCGWFPLLYPAIEIEDPENRNVWDAVMAQLDAYDWVLCVSPSAVDKALSYIRARCELPRHWRFIAMGMGSARALAHFGVTPYLVCDPPFDSETLLKMPALQVSRGERVLIFRGIGGRELLAQRWRELGAIVEDVSCYQQAKPRWAPTPLLTAWERGEVAAGFFTSIQGVRYFFAHVGREGQGWLKKTLCIVTHPRVAEQAQALGMLKVKLSSPGDLALIKTLAQSLST